MAKGAFSAVVAAMYAGKTHYVPNNGIPELRTALAEKARARNGLAGVRAADVFVTNGAMPDKPEAFERIIDMFDGNDAVAVEKARARWKNYKDGGHDISYMKQTAGGGWEKAA